MKLAQEIKICHLGGPARFEYLLSSLPEGSGNWLVRIRGERPTQLTEVTNGELVEYANCRREIEAVKRYINRYGPPLLLDQDKDGFFYADTLGRWNASQIHFWEVWDRFLGIEVRNSYTTEGLGKYFPELWKRQEPWIRAQGEGEFQVASGRLIFVAKTHFMALQIKLLAVSATGKLRKCLNPNCSNTPYFIAEHGKSQYCCEVCGHWGQKRAKLRYWNDHKKGRPTESKPSPV